MAKNDLPRLGIFSEPGYITINDKYRPRNDNKPFNTSAYKSKQMLIGHSKTKAADQSGYFAKTFDRVFTGEAYSDPVKKRRQEKIQQTKKNLSKAPFIPSSGSKEPSGVGSLYGTFSKPVASFSPLAKTQPPYLSEKKNFSTSPAKKGTGYGYINVTIGGEFKHLPDPYSRIQDLRKKERLQHAKAMKGASFKLNNYPTTFFETNPFKQDKTQPLYNETFDSSKEKPKPFKPSNPAKSPGGCKAGTFDPYPSHSVDPYQPRTSKGSSKEKKVFQPTPGVKPYPISSVVSQNVQRRMNRNNFLMATPAS